MTKSASDFFIVDNSDGDWKVRSYLTEWCDLSKAIDIATGYFEIGSLLCLKEKWQTVDRIRILMGDEVSYRTKRAFVDGLRKAVERLDQSLEGEKAQNDFLQGVPAIVEAIRSGKIQCRIYRKDKFHAKAYITHGRAAVVGSFGLVGSSNFTYPGLSDNVELNVQIRGPEVGLLQQWYERHWNDSEDVTPDVLRTLERHTREHTPFEVWFRALDEFLRGHELTPDEWDKHHSQVFSLLDKYQQDAYKKLVEIGKEYRGAFLCDGVGLGKTFVGLMLLERMVVREGRRVVLLAPKATREDVWAREIQRHLPDLNSGFVSFVVYNHTDLQRKGKWQRDIALTIRDADVLIIDEAHHFRNPGIKGEGVKEPSRYRWLQQHLQSGDRPKQLFFLTATPINNTVHDFRHMVELFTNADDRYFARTLGIHSIPAHFVQLEKKLLGKGHQMELEFGTEIFDAEKALKTDPVFDALVVQRSRAYVKESQRQNGSNQVIFPVIRVVNYRPFDKRVIYYSSDIVTYPNFRVMDQFKQTNLGLICSRIHKGEAHAHEFATREMIEIIFLSSKSSNNAFLFPLFTFDSENVLQLNDGGIPNLSSRFLKALSKQLGFNQKANPALVQSLTAEDIFYYIYGILHNPTYRTRYAEFLKIDFPRVPITSSLELFRSLAKLGGELVALHLLESPKVNDFITRFVGAGDNSIPKKPTWKDNAVWINPTQRFEGVPEAIWNFHIGGYQVCEKWLKARKGRTLSEDDITHYQRIVVALNETIRLMAEIDKVIDQHGGWPIN